MLDTAAILHDCASTLSAGDLLIDDNLIVLPLRSPPSGPEVVTLPVALRHAHTVVTEVSAEGRVPELLVRHSGPLPLLLLHGEELIGAKQNRVLNQSVLVPSGSEIKVPVSCIEAGRWRHAGREFESMSRSLPSSLKQSTAHRMTRSLRSTGRTDAGQSEVWREVADYAATRGVHSRTQALSDVFEADRAQLRQRGQTLARPEGVWSGLAAWVNGRLVGVELLGRAQAAEQAWDRIVHSYAADALRGGGPNSAPGPATTAEGLSQVVALLRWLAVGSSTEHPAPGRGREARVSRDPGHAVALVDEVGALVHLELFAG